MRIRWQAKVLSVFVVAALVLGCAAQKPTEEVKGKMKAGTYEVDATGMKDMKVKVVLTDAKIDSVEVVSHEETPGVSDEALEQIPKLIIEKQTPNVDTVTGATLTSQAIIDAVKKAITDAGGNPSDFADAAKVASDTPKKNDVASVPQGNNVPDKWDDSYDVIVVGGGFAGLSATYEAANLGDKVLLVEKMPVLGGNSQINGGVYASYTSKIADEMYKKLNLEPDTAEKHIEDSIKGGDFMGDPKLVKNFVYGAPVFLDLMLDNGLEVRESITRPGGHYGYRTYTTINGVGADIVKVQKELVEKAGATVDLNTKLTKLYRSSDDGRVQGISVEDKDGNVRNVEAKKGVILTTGGFSGNVEMRSKHVPYLGADFPTTNHVGATGEAIPMAQEVGANTLQMSYIQLYPFADPNNGRLDAPAVIPFSGPSSGIVYVDYKGERYVNEGERRDVCAMAAQNSGGFPTFSIFAQNMVDDAGFITETQLEAGMKDDRIFKADTLEELAKIINEHTFKDEKVDMDPATLAKTIDTHNGYVKNGEDPDFGKKIDKGVMLTTEVGPFYAVPQWPSVHHTMGGLSINEKTQVLDMWGEVIPGLYAAGEITGGVHGTNRLGSNAIPDAAVHGIIAATVASTGDVPEFAKGK